MVVAAHDLLEISSVSGSTITTGWVKPVSGSLYTFTAMVDTPDTYVGQADKLVAVNAGESDLEFIIRTPSSTVVSETSYGQAADAGSVTSSFSRGDHTHGTPAALIPASSVVAETSFGQSSVVGTGSNFARQDHSHGTPKILASYDFKNSELFAGVKSYYVANTTNGNPTLGTSKWIIQDALYATPFIMANGGYINQICFHIGVAGGVAGTCRVGIYKATSQTNLYPHDLILDCGNFSFTAGAWDKWVYPSPLALDPTEIYYFVINSNATFGVYTINQLCVSNLLGYRWTGFAGHAFSLIPNAGIVVVCPYNLPNPFTPGGGTWGDDSDTVGSIAIWYAIA